MPSFTMPGDNLQVQPVILHKPSAEAFINTSFVAKDGMLLPWSKCRVKEVTDNKMYQVVFQGDVNQMRYEYPEYRIAPNIAPQMQLSRGTRVIAPTESNRLHYYAGVVAEAIERSNKHRYLIFFDNGCVRYVSPSEVRVVKDSDGCMNVHENARQFFRNYFDNSELATVPTGNAVTVEYRDKWYHFRIIGVDGDSLIRISYDGIDRIEWIYRGSPRFKPIWEEYLRKHQGDCADTMNDVGSLPADVSVHSHAREERQRRVSSPPERTLQTRFRTNSRCQHFKLDHPKPTRYVRHECGPSCCERIKIVKKDKRMASEFGPLLQPLIMGWRRDSRSTVSYIAPCGKSIRNPDELKTHLEKIQCKTLEVDNFCFDRQVDCLRECRTSLRAILCQDITNGIEARRIRVFNEYNQDQPERFEYLLQNRLSQRVATQLDGENLSCYDCEDDCSDQDRCTCWQLTLAGSCYTHHPAQHFGYVHHRLESCIPTGIWECNVNCKCSRKCSNRVAQMPVKNDFELCMTPKGSWSVRCVNDLPRGAFVSCFFGELVMQDEIEECDDIYSIPLNFIEEAERHKTDFGSNVYHNDTAPMDIHSDSDQDTDIVINYLPKFQLNSVHRDVGRNDMKYIINARKHGNFSRFFNRSSYCETNMFLQYVYTHDSRVPQIAFFAQQPIKAGTELTYKLLGPSKLP